MALRTDRPQIILIGLVVVFAAAWYLTNETVWLRCDRTSGSCVLVDIHTTSRSTRTLPLADLIDVVTDRRGAYDVVKLVTRSGSVTLPSAGAGNDRVDFAYATSIFLHNPRRSSLNVAYTGPSWLVLWLLSGPLIPMAAMFWIFSAFFLPGALLGSRRRTTPAGATSQAAEVPRAAMRPPRRSIRRPLIIGGSPMLFLLFVLPLLPFTAVARPDNAWLLAFPAIVIVRWAFHRRASDVVLGSEGIHVEGNRGRAFVAWDEIADCEIRAAGKAFTIGRDEILAYTLCLALRNGSDETIANAAGVSECKEIEEIAESIHAIVNPEGPAPAPSTPSRSVDPRVLVCDSCGSPAVPRDQDAVKCVFCGAEVAVPEAVRVSLRTSAQAIELRTQEVATVERLLVQPSARRTTGLQIAAWACAFGATVAWGVGRSMSEVLALVCLTGIAVAFERSTIFDRQALQGIAGSLGALPPQREGAGSACRVCGAPLPQPPDASLVQCIACGADNILDIDVRSQVQRSQSTLVTLSEVLRQRRAKRRTLVRAVVALGAVGCLAAIARLHQPPNVTNAPAADVQLDDLDVPIRFDGSAR